MERARQWIQTLALAAIGAAALVVAVGTVLPATAAEPPTCTKIQALRVGFDKAADELALQATAALSVGREHAVVIPVGGAINNGVTTALLCVW